MESWFGVALGGVSVGVGAMGIAGGLSLARGDRVEGLREWLLDLAVVSPGLGLVSMGVGLIIEHGTEHGAWTGEWFGVAAGAMFLAAAAMFGSLGLRDRGDVAFTRALRLFNLGLISLGLGLIIRNGAQLSGWQGAGLLAVQSVGLVAAVSGFMLIYAGCARLREASGSLAGEASGS